MFTDQFGWPMKNPAIRGGVSLQFKLRLPRLLLALIPHILPNGGFVDAYRGGDKSSRPHSSTISIQFAQPVREFHFQQPTDQGLHHP
jgi:hypothetical protein